ncbi:hypothetical protein EUX98_g4673 [Antrodiella citrinella]|uniref:RING-type E3 ubiquitin transferase n=1 Tax=Antrodiella citrinella TaxID=2447956 RepID=A0A4S4MVB1_9APHY|nr:hypothetical protein EUX98_g4673 [Antrodiella citrinella]
MTTSYNETTTAFLHVLFTHPMVRNISADILSGQIIASVIVLGFVAVFLLREWISQNARPGVFDDAEAPPEGDAPPPLLPAEPDAPAPVLPPAQVAPPLLLDGPLIQRPNIIIEDQAEPSDTGRRTRRRVREGDSESVAVPPPSKKGKEPVRSNLKVATKEFEAGPSNYFQSSTSHLDNSADSDETLIEDLQDEHHHYFRETEVPLPQTPEEDFVDMPESETVRWHEEDGRRGRNRIVARHPPAVENYEMPDLVPVSDEDDEDEDEYALPFEGEMDDEEHEEEHQLPVGPAPRLADARPRPEEQQPPRPDQDLMDQEEIDAAMEDDMDGALEAIGLRGPLYGVVQNAGLMILVLDITIAVLVWLPFTVGKTLALLALNPRRSVQLLHSPLRAIRFVTDPIVDLTLYLIARTIFPPLIRLGESIGNTTFSTLTALVGEHMAVRMFDFVVEISNRSVQAANATWEYVLPHIIQSPEAAAAAVESGPSFMERLASQDSVFFRYAEPYFAPIGHTVRVQSADAKKTWITLAVGSGTSSRLFAICLGYAVDALLLALYLNVLTVGSVKSAGIAVRNAVRQQLLVVKVAGFIIVELVVFPLGCGVMLDICTVWLFPHGSFRSRAAFLMFAPLTAAFYHWVLGTMFMYQFAVLLAGCRSIMRSGAMWFIKDPQDQNFHPIRDILERPTFVQIRKLLLSAVMYGLVVLSGVATVSGLLRIFSRTIMPFRWKVTEPLSEVPIDLLFLLIALPYTLHYFRPKRFIHKAGTRLWRTVSRLLRLTSYMFGERHASEEYTPTGSPWRQLFVQQGIEMDDSEAKHDGTFRRVPNNDNVALVKHESATIEVDAEGEPLSDRDRRLLALQNAEAEKMKRNVKEDYIIVYLPPHFRYRIVTFIFTMWVIGSTGLALALAGPIFLGRGFFGLFLSRQVHDGYSFLAGFYLLWACWLIAVAVERMDKRRQRRSGSEPRAQFPLYLAKRTLLWIAQVAYLVFFLGFVIPTLVALVMELYIILPARMSINADLEPRIRIVDMWALGLVYSKIALRAHRMQAADGRIARGIDHIRRTGWTHPDPFRATKEVIIPLTGGLFSMILVPAILLWGARRLDVFRVDDNFLFLHVYPSLFTVAGCAHGISALSSLIGTWSQSVRDKEFLVEMRLQNLEADVAAKEKKQREKEKERAESASPVLDADQYLDEDD